MQTQAGIAVADGLCRLREVQARRLDFRTLGLCRLCQGAAGYAEFVSGARAGQRHTPASFPQAREQFRRVGHFTHHYFHPNTPLLAAQDMCEPY
jgi:hypothetical protein